MKGVKKLGLKENIKYFRTKCDMTLEEVAKYLGISKPTVQRYESGVIKNIPPDKIKQLSELFNITPSELYGWDEMYPDAAIEANAFKEFVKYLNSLNYNVVTLSDSIVITYEGKSITLSEEEFTKLQEESKKTIQYSLWKLFEK